MLNIKRALSSDRTLRALTGMNRREFNGILPTFDKIIQEAKLQKAQLSHRERKPGGGRTHTLKSSAEKLFYILFYLKCYPTFDLAGLFFNVDRSQANRWLQELLNYLEKSLNRKLVLPKRKIKSVEEFIRLYPQIKDLFIDGTERPIERPKSSKRQGKHYSGKKKRHTRKNIVINDEKKRILILGKTKAGKYHDWRQLQKDGTLENLPKGLTIWSDLGFQGMQARYPHLEVMLPHKKPRGKELSQEQKEENKIISGIRIISEHAIGGIKRLKALTDVCRNKKRELEDKFIFLASGIWNYHLSLT